MASKNSILVRIAHTLKNIFLFIKKAPLNWIDRQFCYVGSAGGFFVGRSIGSALPGLGVIPGIIIFTLLGTALGMGVAISISKFGKFIDKLYDEDRNR